MSFLNRLISWLVVASLVVTPAPSLAAVPTAITDLSTTAATNSPQGSESIGTSLDDYLRAGYAFTRQLFNVGSIYSATVGGTANAITLTPSPAISAYTTGQSFEFIVASTNTAAATVNVSSVGAKDIKKLGSTGKVALVANDMVAATIARITYDGTDFILLNPAPGSHGADIASASTTDLDTATGDLVDVTGTTTITAITLAEGRAKTARFTGALTLTHGASLVLPGGANITTAAGDYAIFRGYASGVVRCVLYMPAAGYAPLNSPVFTGTPSLPTGTTGVTQSAGDNSTKLATTAFVTANRSAIISTTTYATNTTISNNIPLDDTIPQQGGSEGTEIMSIAYTPKSATSTIVVQWEVYGSSSGTAVMVISPLFKDSTANAVKTASNYSANNGVPVGVSGVYTESAGSTSSRTYRVRVGVNSGNFFPNGTAGSTRVFGGTSLCAMRVIEILP